MTLLRLLTLVCFSSLALHSVFAEEVRVATWPEYGKNAGLVLAQVNGNFEKVGIDLKLIDTFQNGLVLLEGGAADAAQVFCSAAMTSIRNGMKAKIVAARDQRSPVATVSLPKSNIKVPADYAGKRWGHSAGFSPEKSMLARLLSDAGSKIDSVDLINVDFPARLPALLAGEVDFVSAWRGSGLPVVVAAARNNGQTLDVVRWDKFGVDAYGECFVVKVDENGEPPAWITRFLSAARAGYAASVKDPAAALKAVSAMPKAGDPALLSIAVEEGNELLISEGQSISDILSVTPEGLSRTASWAGLPQGGVVDMIAQ